VNLSVVIPVHNGGENLRCCLEALSQSTRPADEVIVVDDASTDGSADLAQKFGVHVLHLPGPPQGAAIPRNRGAAVASGEVLVFLDADVAVHTDALEKIERTMSEHQGIAALFGSYDAYPRAPGLASRYKNLLHHYVHQHGGGEASTFWTGCGAIRREVFESVGGFDESLKAIEDIELGTRVRRAGYRIWLCPDVQVTHLKRWTLGRLLRSDVFDRAIPWSRLVLQSAHLPAVLNLAVRSRWSALAAWAAVLLAALAWWWPWAGVAALLSLFAVGALNADLYRFFWRHGGLLFAVVAAGLHVFYLLYSSLVFVLVAGQTVLGRLFIRARGSR
jgi:glycosyltransferase involved in cell wall biosynthesis